MLLSRAWSSLSHGRCGISPSSGILWLPISGTFTGLTFIPFVFGLSVLFAAVLNNTKGSLLAVLAYHASGDTPGFFVHLSSRAYEINVTITVIVAILFVLVLGATNLSRTTVRSTVASA